jgi:hypothetical protein
MAHQSIPKGKTTGKTAPVQTETPIAAKALSFAMNFNGPVFWHRAPDFYHYTIIQQRFF